MPSSTPSHSLLLPPVGVVDERRRAVQQVAAVDGLQVREVDDRIAVGVAPAQVVRPHLDAAEVDRRLVGVDDARAAASCSLRIMFLRAFSWAMTSAESMNPTLPPAWSPW